MQQSAADLKTMDFMSDPSYNRLRRQNMKLQQKVKSLILISKLCTSLAIIMFCVMMVMGGSYFSKSSALKTQINTLQQTNTSITASATSIAQSYDLLAETYKTLAVVSTELNTENQALKEQNTDMDARLTVFEKRSELYDKYDYSIIRKDNTRTDIDYEDLEDLESYAKTNGMNQDEIDLTLAIAMSESKGTENSTSATSTAKGVGQFLNGTGTFVYEKLMGGTNYNSTVAYDSATNLKMVATYINYLNDKYNGNVDAIVNNYRGLVSTGYKSEINSYLSAKNLSLVSLDLVAD